MKENKPFIGKQFINAFSPNIHSSLNELYDFNQDHQNQDAKKRTIELRQNLGIFFGLAQAIAGLRYGF